MTKSSKSTQCKPKLEILYVKQEFQEGKVRDFIEMRLARNQVGPDHLGNANSCTQTVEKPGSWLSGKQLCREELKACGGQVKRKSAMHTCDKKGQQHCQEVIGGDPSPLHNTDEATAGVLYPILGSWVQERHGHTKVSPAKAHRDEGTEASFVQRDAESWDCLAWKTGFRGILPVCINYYVYEM